VERTIQFDVLGPLRVRTDAGEVPIRGTRDRIVLAMLLLHPGEMVLMERLVDAVWESEPPQNARNQVQGCVSRLRKQLAAAGAERQIVTTPHGYLIDVGHQNVDLLQFRQLRDEARSATAEGDREAARSKYRAALMLWRGIPLSDIDSPVVRRITVAMDEDRAQALEERIEIDLALGGAGQMVAELTALVEQYPYREALQGALMRALFRAGRQAEALAVYRGVRQLLRDELGAEPGEDLQQLHQAILSQDPALRSPPPTKDHAVIDRLIPRELPADVAGFTGRIEALAKLDKLLPGGEAVTPGPVVISAIAGMAGVGKTALAVHWAHQIADRFPDGQLYVNLHGFDPMRPPMEPAQAIRGFLDALQVPADRIPIRVEAQAGMYRSLVADRRMLVMLDNARDAAQVRPLLPGSNGCMVLVTSRNQLPSLVSFEGAHPLELDMMTDAESRQLLEHRLGAERLAAEPEATDAIITRCARLPLALAIVAARAKTRPGRPLSSLASELHDAHTSLDAFSSNDLAIDLRVNLELSYRALTAEAAHLYRLLGLHPGPDFEPYAVAALADTTLARARLLLDQLLDTHLLQEPAPSRYVFHDLIRAHATDTAASNETELAQRAALTRLLDHYRHTASVAMDVAYPHGRRRRPDVPGASPNPDLTDKPQAMGWLDGELPNLLAVVRHTADRWPEHTWHLSSIMQGHLIYGRYGDAEFLHRLALTAARSAGQPESELMALTSLARVLRLQGQYEPSFEHCRQALALARTIGNRGGEIEALIGLGAIYRMQGHHEEAVEHCRGALELARATGDRAGEIDALIGIGQIHKRQVRYEQAINCYRPALDLARATGDHASEMNALIGLGIIHRLLDLDEQALDYFNRALEFARATGNRSGELNALVGIGRVYQRQVQYDPAIACYLEALELARAIGHRSSELTALAGLGHMYQRQGQYELAASQHYQVLDIAREMSDRNWQFEALQGLGRLDLATGRPGRALANHKEALALVTDLRQPDDQARAHDGLAHAHHALGEPEVARQHWEHALRILTSLGINHTDDEDANVQTIRTHLAGLNPQSGSDQASRDE
jgi:DNA-binding SARP family transcriptional activator/tetratricopeptide (TPR) repeat protein